ncbi:acetoacetate decarboxylase family protein [Humibacillus xanthopallidus]|uniref:Acetoacetate decarboxylase n=1 Tax=Humibacillus xanthopallidus TaxID=412689 RepID=A0A543I278_9MICO|nr:acetoacetate decarboxylase family protein [Humibacillus xanthopallidus]TQM64672.1 acetoacetate decarboxylase [Humibacillus xanthopallidus]
MTVHLRRRRRDDDFYRFTADRPVMELDGFRLRPPFYYHRADAFKSLHLASYDAVRAILPSDDLNPMRWFDGRAMIGLGVFRYEHVSVEDADGTIRLLAPYGEIAVVALASRGRSRVRGFGALQVAMGSSGGFILDLPVTTREACDGGRNGYGMAKFVADMDFTEEPGHRKVVLSEEDAHIFTLSVRASGPVLADREPAPMYSVQHGQLIETVIRFQGHRQSGLGAGAGRLVLGEHPVADRLRALGVATEPVMVGSYLDARLILPTGTSVGAARDYVGHLGRDRDRGRLTVAYPGTDPIDLYAVPAGILPSRVSSTADVVPGARV